MAQGLLVNYQWCTGCHSCEIACQVKNDLPEGQFGIKVNQIGPWEYAPKKWQYTFLPVLTEQCTLCADRQAEGKLPSCVQHCQANCIRILEANEVASLVEDHAHVMFMRK